MYKMQLSTLTDTARVVCVRSIVRPSVCLSHRSTAAAVIGGFAAKRPADRGYRSTAAGAGVAYQLLTRSTTNAGNVMLRADG